MDRDVALQLSTKLTAVKTALQTLVISSTPSTPATLSMSRMENIEEPEPVEPEPETRGKK